MRAMSASLRRVTKTRLASNISSAVSRLSTPSVRHEQIRLISFELWGAACCNMATNAILCIFYVRPTRWIGAFAGLNHHKAGVKAMCQPTGSENEV